LLLRVVFILNVDGFGGALLILWWLEINL